MASQVVVIEKMLERESLFLEDLIREFLNSSDARVLERVITPNGISWQIRKAA